MPIEDIRAIFDPDQHVERISKKRTAAELLAAWPMPVTLPNGRVRTVEQAWT